MNPEHRPDAAPQGRPPGYNAPNPLQDVAASAPATARYLADIQRVVRDTERHLATLADETSVHLRGTHLQGDRFWHAKNRARPVEKALRKVLRDAKNLAADLEAAAYSRHAFDENCANTVKERKEKELEKQRKKNPQQIPPMPAAPPGLHSKPESGYASPVSNIHDLRGRESA
ncbi:hypothetical protein [Streptomyces sp. TLI_105]|uniref:hypothetical protein n=1 Tax=Streptomyces sp. TLI_105 TaxID=1881019 RepID=UPI00089C0B2E|nr:hypothetical protein [Streptomyces sp. TLI_105]SEE61334.1 hypothetical protein SAMN05428939_8144 [Streptomyces sp. TLI_105]